MIRLKVIKNFLFISILLLSFSQGSYTFAQIINIDIEIEPEIKTDILNQLEFPDLIANSGEVSIELGDPRMGIFSITALSSQNLYLEVNYPQYLVSTDSNINDTIPLEINSYFSKYGLDKYLTSKPLINNKGSFAISQNNTTSTADWETVYILITGSINIGQISDGNYRGIIELLVEYD